MGSLLVLVAVFSFGGCAVNPGYETPEEALLLDEVTRDVAFGDPKETLKLPDEVAHQIEAAV
jgi:hypothetical protein